MPGLDDTSAAATSSNTDANDTIATPTDPQKQPALTRNERKRRFREEQAAARLVAGPDGTASKKKPLRMPASAFLPPGQELVQRRCVVAYDGSGFQGFQAQEQREAMRTVQETIEDALLRTTGETIRIRAASRTDAGVHARGQVIAFTSRCSSDDRVFRDALNNRLPEDVLCRSMTRITGTNGHAEPFDPRAHSKRKTYAYTVVNGGLRPVFGRERVWFVKKPLDVAKMREASAFFFQAPAAKDYSSFTPQKALADHDGGSGNVCTITSIEISIEVMERDQLLRLGTNDDTDTNDTSDQDTGRRIEIVFQGDRFLYKMVRNLVGTLVDVGLGRITPESILLILEAKSRSKAGQGAPPQGLTLVHIDYDT
ncbi:tRNA uridine synthase [Globisporangium polare]